MHISSGSQSQPKSIPRQPPSIVQSSSSSSSIIIGARKPDPRRRRVLVVRHVRRPAENVGQHGLAAPLRADNNNLDPPVRHAELMIRKKKNKKKTKQKKPENQKCNFEKIKRKMKTKSGQRQDP
jgi:hypothetical protein